MSGAIAKLAMLTLSASPGIPLRIEGAVSRNRQSPTTIGATQSKTPGPVRRRRPTIQAIQPLFEVATTRAESGVVLINEPPLANSEPKAADLWLGGGGVGLSPTYLKLFEEVVTHRCQATSCKSSRGFRP